MTDWSLLDAGTPIADRVGPFARSGFLSTLWRHVDDQGGTPDVRADGAGAVAFELDGGLRLIGPENLVDYRSPIGDPSRLVLAAIDGLPPGTPLAFDSLPAEAIEPFIIALDKLAIGVEPVQHEVTAVLDLPPTFDDYMTAIGKKERHETRRKRRRLVEEIGEPRIVTYSEPGPALTRFFELHRSSPGDKGSFMTPRMEGLFTDLLGLPGWRLDALFGESDVIHAAVFGAIDGDGYYLYNSAWDPELNRLSPGVVLLNALIERSIESGLAVFDFLKGSEVYKFRMGAEERPLYRLDAVR